MPRPLHAQRVGVCRQERAAHRLRLHATAFAQDDADAATAQWRKVAGQFRPKLFKLAAFLDEAETDVLCPNALPNQSAPTTVDVAVETPKHAI